MDANTNDSEDTQQVQAVVQLIIAMKGDAYTGKTTCANAIAKYYNCAVIRYDDILDSISPSSGSPSPEEADRLENVAFDVILRVAKPQLVMWRPIVIDSPLVKSSHIDKVLDLAAEMQSCGKPHCHKWHCKVVIVECRSESTDIWKSRFDRRDPTGREKWHKPQEWGDLLVQSTTAEQARQFPNFVSRLVVDTTSQSVNKLNLGPATLDLCSCSHGLGHSIDFRYWLPRKPLHKYISTARINAHQNSQDQLPHGSLGGVLEKIVGEHEREPHNVLPIMIAMKGDAYTGKTTCAKAIAKSYKCTIISFDDILDSLSGDSPPRSFDPQLMDVAFNIIVTIARAQLGMGRPVIIDSPLNKPSHLRQLLHLMDELKSLPPGAYHQCDTFDAGRFVIVECRPEATYAWQQKFEGRDRGLTDRWYKPQEWEKVVQTESVANYPKGQLPDYVCRLIINTTEHVTFPWLGPVTLDMCWCPSGHLTHFKYWLPSQKHLVHDYLNFDFLVLKSVVRCGNTGWHFWEEVTTTKTDDSSSNQCCGACQGLISYPDSTYSCRICNLSLHKSCAELEDKTMIDPQQLPRFLRIIDAPVSADEYYSYIPEEYRQIMCKSCRAAGEEFSVACKFCLWETHLRSSLVPTILNHEVHSMDHPLHFWITSTTNPHIYQCDACKLPGSCAGYTCDRSKCMYNLHVECALLRRPFIHNHGGYRHDMVFVYKPEEMKVDSYSCDVCLDPRDPTAWYYYCDICQYISHLHCIYSNLD